jgi:lysine-N-methylase
MLLGFLLEEVDQIISSEKFSNASALLPALESFIGMLGHHEQIEAQYAKIETSLSRKLQIVAQLISQSLGKASSRFKECLQAAFEGLGAEAENGEMLNKFSQNFNSFYLPFFEHKQYIFENYLVNQVVTRLFPFTRGSYLDLYRELVGNLAVLQVLLVGMAAKHKGLNEALVIQLFQTFARNSNHNSGHLDSVLNSLRSVAQDSFVDVMWLLKESN